MDLKHSRVSAFWARATLLLRWKAFFLLALLPGWLPAQGVAVRCLPAAPGGLVSVPIDFSPGASPVVGVQFDAVFEGSLLELDDPAEPVSLRTDHTVVAHERRTVIYSTSNAELGDETVQTLRLRVASDAPEGPAFLTLEQVLLSDAEAREVTPSGVRRGLVQVTPGLFSSGFECGDTSLWSATVPSP